MNSLKKYELTLAKRYNLPDTRCIYNPNVYWKLSKHEQDTIQTLRKNC